MSTLPNSNYLLQVCYLLLFLLLYIIPKNADCQKRSGYSTFYPISEHTYDIKSGLPDMYMTQVIVDTTGRMHILKNGVGRTALPSYIYEYDGIQSHPSAFKTRHKPNRLPVDAVPAKCYYGFYQLENEEGLESEFFKYDLVARTNTYINISDSEEKGVICSFTHRKGIFYVLVFHQETSQYKVLQIKDDVIFTSSSFQLDSLMQARSVNIGVTDTDYWAAFSAHEIYRISRTTHSIKRYSLPNNPKNWAVQKFSSSTKDLWLVNGAEIYRWNPTNDRFTKNPHKPVEWKSDEIIEAKIFIDAKGNVLARYRNEIGAVSATLVDTTGQEFDFTPVLSDHSTISGSNFKQQLTFFNPGLRFVDVSSRKGIKSIFGFNGTRGMVELDSQALYISAGGKNILVTYENEEWKTEINPLTCLKNAFIDSDLAKDANGKIWFASGPIDKEGKMNFYYPEKGDCESYDLGFRIYRFNIIGDGRMVIAGRDSIYFWKEQDFKPVPICKQPAEGLNQIFIDKDGLVWEATDEGLFKIDTKTNEQHRINLFGDENISVISMLQDADGRFWLGTSTRGVIIYSPSSGDIQVVDLSVGLSNNTVVSLLEDNDGDIWAGTFHGITIISPGGEVIGKLYEEDGLANNECNRWSSLKMKDGRLCFGSVIGATIIDPSLWKSPLEGFTHPKIYLTELTNGASGKKATQAEDLLPILRNNERIVLPANNRNLKATFVLSNYASPEKSTFSYQLEGKDESWNYIGTQRQLSLNALPIGNYNILIRGTDGRGKWSDPPIKIPVTVEKFFYQKWWFFVLCAMPFIAFFLLWQHRQRGERKRLELEVQNRTATIREQAEQLMELDQVKTRLYTNITHEFRTPLTVISGMADMIKEPANSKKIIHRNTQSLLRLVNQMLDLSKLESGQLKLDLVQADIVYFLNYLVESFKSYAESKNIHLSFQVEADQMMMDFDKKKLESIVSNLLSNAIKFSKDKGEVVLKLQKKKDQLLLQVMDTGIGIPAEKLPNVFDRFYQVDNSSTRRGEGTGIGLTLTKELVGLMGGKISVESPAPSGEGTMFTVLLPITQNAPFDSVVTNSPALSTQEYLVENEPASYEESQLVNEEELPLLLLVEDNADVTTYIKTCLRGHYLIEWAENGAIGIDKALEMIPDIIISDVMMPEKDGFEVCQTLKNDERTSHVPIVMLTAKADVDSRLEGLGVGADAYLAKPFLREELIIRLEKLVELRKRLQEKYASMIFEVQKDKPQTQSATSPEEVFLEKATVHIHEHLDDSEFGNAQLSRQMSMSESQLNRKLKALTGLTLSLFIRDVRLQQGKILLQTSDLNISEIAYAVGFSDPFYFSRTFSQKFGQAPSKFRE